MAVRREELQFVADVGAFVTQMDRASSATKQIELDLDALNSQFIELDTDELARQFEREARSLRGVESAMREVARTTKIGAGGIELTSQSLAQAGVEAKRVTSASNRTNAAITQLSFGFQDIATVLATGGGWQRAVASASNNLGYMASVLAPGAAGAAAALAVALVPLIPSLIGIAKGAEEGADKLEEEAAQLERVAKAAAAAREQQRLSTGTSKDLINAQKDLQQNSADLADAKDLLAKRAAGLTKVNEEQTRALEKIATAERELDFIRRSGAAVFAPRAILRTKQLVDAHKELEDIEQRQADALKALAPIKEKINDLDRERIRLIGEIEAAECRQQDAHFQRSADQLAADRKAAQEATAAKEKAVADQLALEEKLRQGLAVGVRVFDRAAQILEDLPVTRRWKERLARERAEEIRERLRELRTERRRRQRRRRPPLELPPGAEAPGALERGLEAGTIKTAEALRLEGELERAERRFGRPGLPPRSAAGRAAAIRRSNEERGKQLQQQQLAASLELLNREQQNAARIAQQEQTLRRLLQQLNIGVGAAHNRGVRF